MLIHQLPPEPLYLRAKIRQRLSKVGAVALKNAVYALPHQDDCLEDFQWIAQEATAGGGEAYVCEADFLDKQTQRTLVERFREERDGDYETLANAIQAWSARAATRNGTVPAEADPAAQLTRARRRFEEISQIDFFHAKKREKVETLLHEVERKRKSLEGSAGGGPKRRNAELRGRTWVTRKGIHVDRMASAWFVRRRIDPKARFQFVDPKREEKRPGEIRFDMVNGDFTHEGDRCTFETFLQRFQVKDPTLKQIAEIVHDIDLKDGKFGRPEARGVEQILAGLLLTHPDDEARLERGFALFDELYESFRGKKPSIQTKEVPK